jgi:predicted nucleic acid-binding protein
MPIVDTSAFVRYLSREPGWERGGTYLDRPLTVALALKEVSNALRTKTLNGEIDRQVAIQLISKLSMMVKLVDHGDLLVDSYQIAVNNRITVYDALFIAAALWSSEDLVTCDVRQATVARAMGVKVTVWD